MSHLRFNFTCSIIFRVPYANAKKRNPSTFIASLCKNRKNNLVFYTSTTENKVIHCQRKNIVIFWSGSTSVRLLSKLATLRNLSYRGVRLTLRHLSYHLTTSKWILDINHSKIRNAAAVILTRYLTRIYANNESCKIFLRYKYIILYKYIIFVNCVIKTQVGFS